MNRANRVSPPGGGKASAVVGGVPITHPDRVVFPDLAITKRGLAAYYRTVAAAMLREIAGRPLSSVRCPAGVGGECFFQKHFRSGLESLRRVSIREKSGRADYLVVRHRRDLIALVQQGVVEIHPWGARADDPERPDRMVFDLDPSPEAGFGAAVEAALTLRDRLTRLDLASFVKTTGGKGLHVVVPLRRGPSWREVKEFARAVAATFTRANPAAYTIAPAKSARGGKVFIDYLRNDRGATAVAPYSARARPGATVAFPLPWSALKPGLNPARFTVATVPRLIAARSDPWRALYRTDQTLTAAARKALGVR